MPNAPAVSVVIPMYNVEKYITETLESILAQTFQNFEVIVVDDCSTDSSCDIVENYIPKFDGRLKLSLMDKNSGKPSAPRNKGLLLSRGEYIFFMDNDDMLAPNALEQMYAIAKNFDADVLNCMAIYTVNEEGGELTLVEDPNPVSPKGEFLAEEDLRWRIKNILKARFTSGPWRKFTGRDFLLENKIFFPEDVEYAEDHIWTYEVFLLAKKVVHVPYGFYYFRSVQSSVSRAKISHVNKINRWVSTLTCGIK